jgi:predicted nucleic acid-binding protein
MTSTETAQPASPPPVEPSASGPLEFLDTNTLARYLIRDNPAMTDRAAALIDSERSLRIGVVVLAEVGYLLTTFYRIERPRAVDAIIELLNRENIEAHEIATDLAIQALRLCRPSRRVGFADALLWAVARSVGPARVWSFDTRFPIDGIEAREP